MIIRSKSVKSMFLSEYLYTTYTYGIAYTHRLWSNFKSGGRIMRVKRARGCALRENRGMLPPTDNFLRMA